MRDDSSQIIEDIKWFMFDDATGTVKNEKGFSHGLEFDTWAGDEHSFIVNNDDGTKYRVCVYKETM